MSEQASSEAVPQRHLAVRAVLRTDVGLVRSENQDFGIYTNATEESTSHPGGRLLIVADGMGGHRGGATASRLAGETVKMQYLDSETTDIPTALRQSLSRANARIYSEAQSNPELRGMGTTTSVLAVRDHFGWLAHVGDSRIYLVRDGVIKQLTDDHSLVATMVREGLLTSAEAETHPRRNVLQRSMGVSEEVEIDVRGPFELREGDTFILCSDGLHGVVKEHELQEIATGTIEEAADEFLRRALERGAPDNVTVIVARVEVADGPPPASLEHFEDTQPLDEIEDDAYDETVKETQKLKAVTPDDLRELRERDTDKLVAVKLEDDTLRMNVPPGIAIASPTVARASSKSNSALRWMLIVVLALGAAGAWYVWNQQQHAVSSRSR
ncbi:MAG TPA: Stp1/IreP family PP2C-type Ser/Thr phosphatase [Thermoanaerobaculia bacterium]|jgi:protein phosphatase|nr:Stp1/IreP family PP2C-type Ser/Thr phosphatase [Thermoanaerobaculia bacterium]